MVMIQSRQNTSLVCTTSAMDTIGTATEVVNGDTSSASSACRNPECLTSLAVAENLALEVTEWSTRYDRLRNEDSQLHQKYELRSASLRAVRAHNQTLRQDVKRLTHGNQWLSAQVQLLRAAVKQLTARTAHQAAEDR